MIEAGVEAESREDPGPAAADVLKHDLPKHGLRAGDLGAVVGLYGADGVEVERVRASGQTRALVTLTTADVRSVGESDMLTVRTA